MSKRARNDAEDARNNPPSPSPAVLRMRARRARDAEARKVRQEAARERIRNMKMPSHPEPLTDEQWWAKQRL